MNSSETPLLQALGDRLAHEARDPHEDPQLRDLSEFDDEEQARIREAWATQSEQRQLHAKNAQVSLECLKLCANALLYISQYPDDAVEEWQAGTPRGHIERVERASGKSRERALSRAQHDGFTRIRNVGGVFERTLAEEQGDSPAPHLRRAHWRRQAYGPHSSLRKLIWIRVVRVLGGQSREKPYLVADSDLAASP